MHRDIHLRATFSVHLPLGPVVSQYSGCATLVSFRAKYNNININNWEEEECPTVLI